MSQLNTADAIVALKNRADAIEVYLSALYTCSDVPPRLAEATRYSLLAGGKRLRPVLCLSAAQACLNVDQAEAEAFELNCLPFAAALEMIHTYSLIHDDLPAMDDDNLRRGKPTNHKVFGEGPAILAGDALLTDAFFQMTKTELPPERILTALRLVAEAAGSKGMVGGQDMDLDAEGKQISLEHLETLNVRKTGALIRCACESGAVLAEASTPRRDALRLYGQKLGLAFQITDDLLDVLGNEATLGKSIGHDARHGKSTWPSLLGIERSAKLAEEYSRTAVAALPDKLFPGPEAAFLRALAASLVKRTA